jgi:Ca2+-binding RTX toxin-like protein
MSFQPKASRLLPVAMIAALAVGALTAVIASGAKAPKMITLKAGPEKLLTIQGSDGNDQLTIQGAAPGAITISGNREIKNQRTDCDVNPGATVGFCGDDSVRTIDMNMGEGSDSLGFSESFEEQDPFLELLLQRGGPGRDLLDGSVGDDTQKGGPGRDAIDGNEGNDRINGGPGRDECDGGAGENKVRDCE